MVQFKIFTGSYGTAMGTTADVKANEWLKNNKDVSILDMKYQQVRFGDHSICIMYERK